MSGVLGWHFIRADKRLGFNDGREVVVGEWLTTPDKAMCSRGLHASERAIDALEHCDWSDGWLCRVEMGADVERSADKMVSTSRRCLWMVRADPLLWEWLCVVATDALQQHYPTAPAESWHAIDLRLAELAGLEVSADQRAAARDAARDAAWAAAWAAAWNAAWDAAWAAAWDAQSDLLAQMAADAAGEAL